MYNRRHHFSLSVALLHFAHQGILIKTSTTTLLLGTLPPAEIKIDGKVTPDGNSQKTQIGDISVEKQTSGVVMRLPDSTIEYINLGINLRDAKNHKCDVLIIATSKNIEKILVSIKPKLAIMPGATLEQARDLRNKTGIQTIRADHDTVVDLSDYNALSRQSRLKV